MGIRLTEDEAWAVVERSHTGVLTTLRTSGPPAPIRHRSTRATLGAVIAISQRELRNDSGEIMRRVEAGEAFVVTRNGVPVGELVPIRPRRFVPAAVATATFAGADPLDAERFQRDVDAYLDQDPTPRG